MTLDVRKAAADAAYIAVGIGVLGIQQAQVRRREAQARLASARAEVCGRVRATTGHAGAEVRRLGANLRATVPGRATISGLVEPAVDEIGGRVEVLAVRLQALPARAGRALEAGRTQLAHLRIPLVASA